MAGSNNNTEPQKACPRSVLYSTIPLAHQGPPKFYKKENVITSSYFSLEALTTNIDHEAGSLETKSVQALRLSIDL